jgi:glycosyltransferase involved in cell wall biosynthesis
MNILILSQYFYPDLSSSGQVMTEIAEDLKLNGQSVRVITGLPNYTNSNHDINAQKREIFNGVHITRINYLKLSKNSTIGGLLGWFSFGFMAFIHALKTPNIDSVLIVTNPPILPFLGVFLKKVRGCRFCFLVHDIHPDVAVQIGKSKKDSIMVKIMSFITKTSLKGADRVIALGNDMRERIESKGVRPEKILIIPNWADKSKIFPDTKNNDFAVEHSLAGKFILLYSGNLGLYYNLEDLILVAEKLKDISDLLLLFVGEGGKKAKLIELLETMALKNVKFLPYQSWDRYNQVLNSADIHIVTLSPGMEGISVPSKMYSYMASGKPIAGMISKKSDVGVLIEESDCGFRVDPGDIDGFCENIRMLYDNESERLRLGKNALKEFLESYERKNITPRFLDAL